MAHRPRHLLPLKRSTTATGRPGVSPGTTRRVRGRSCTTTVVAADGAFKRETSTADPNAPIDCFYVYPTVSTDPGVNSDMTADPAELNVVRRSSRASGRSAGRTRRSTGRSRWPACARSARRTATPRPRPQASGTTTWRRVELLPAARQQGPRRRAGRPLSGIVRPRRADAQRDRREAHSVAARLGNLLGTTLAVPKGKDVGGTFKNMPLCQSAHRLDA